MTTTVTNQLVSRVDSDVVKKILNHVDLWNEKRRRLAKVHGPPIEISILEDNSPSP